MYVFIVLIFGRLDKNYFYYYYYNFALRLKLRL